VAVARLERHVVERVLERGELPFDREARSGRRVAVVGGGAASLTCAIVLSRLGDDVTIFEIRGARLAERSLAAMLGVEFRSPSCICAEVPASTLLAEFDAVFLGMDPGESGRATPQVAADAVPGETPAPPEGAGTWELALHEGRPRHEPRPDSHLVWLDRGGRRGPSGLSVRSGASSSLSWPGAGDTPDRSGARGTPYRPPLGTTGRAGGRATACAVRLRTPRSPVAAAWLETLGVRVRHGRIATDPATGRTANPRVFAAGPCTTGCATTVHAVRDAKIAAAALHLTVSAGCRLRAR
jgi:hypothetical protein